MPRSRLPVVAALGLKLRILMMCLLGFAAAAHAQITIQPITTRPCLLSGPEDVADIKARLVIHPHPVESLMNAYLNGNTTQKQTANNTFFNALPASYDSDEKGRRVVEDLTRYDIAVSFDLATVAQRQHMLDLATGYIHAQFGVAQANFPTPGLNNGNLWLEKVIALGFAAMNFPDQADAPMWIDRAVAYMDYEIGTADQPVEFLDGFAREQPRYHDWELLHLSNFLTALKRRCNVDRYDNPVLKEAIEWYARFATPPMSIAGGQPVTPAWGDATYSELGGPSASQQVKYFYVPALFAPAYKTRDPYFSRRLMYWWRKAGSPDYTQQAFSLTNPQILDPRLPDSPQAARGSYYAPTLGATTLRVGTEDADEMTATFLCGRGGLSHENADNGHIDLFAFGVPLALDSMSGPYDPDPTANTWNNKIFAHNTVRFQGQEPTGSDSNGIFNAFGSSDIADYVSGNTKYGSTSVRRVVFVKPDYLVVWDQCNAAQYSDFWLHTPAQTLEWQNHKVISHTPWNVDLDVDFLLPSGSLPQPTISAANPTNDYTTRNTVASQASDPGAPALYTTQGEGRFGEWTLTSPATEPTDLGRNPFPFSRQKFFSVRAPTASGHYLTVWHPRKVGVTPTLTATLTGSTSTSVSLTVNFDGRTDTIAISTSGATITKGGAGTVQFSETYPQSGVSGAARYVKSGYGTTTLTNALTTTGAVEVTMGTLALGAADRIPDTAPLRLRAGGTFDLGAFNETVGDFLLDGGALTGTGTLHPANVEIWGGTQSAPIVASGAFHKKGTTAWTLANLTYAGDTFIDGGTLSINSAFPGTKIVQLAAGATLDLNTSLTLPSGSNSTWAGSVTGTGSLVNNGTLTLTGTGTLPAGMSFTNNGTLDVTQWSGTLPGVFVNNGTLVARPTITAQPQNQTVAAGRNAQFAITASGAGTGTITYQWCFNGLAITDGGNISGATTATLTITGVVAADAGSFTCVASNSSSSATSNAATLTVDASAATGTVVSDSFSDQDRTNTFGGDLLGVPWFTGVSGTASVVSDATIGTGFAFQTPSGGTSKVVAEFPPVALTKTGDFVQLQFDFHFNSAPSVSANAGLRFGLYQTGFTHTTADNQSGSRNDDPGYGAYTDPGGTTNGTKVFAEGSGDDVLTGSGGSGLSTFGTTGASSALGTTKHTAKLVLTLQAGGVLQVSGSIDGTTVTATRNPTLLTTTFNELALASVTSPANFLFLDNVTVTTNNLPRIALTSPTNGIVYATPSATIDLSGTASDDAAVTQVTWVNNRGGSGTASGTSSWSISALPLAVGVNVITVSASNAAGYKGTATLTVTRTQPGALQFTASSYAVNESTGAAAVSVTRTGGTDGAVSIYYATSDGTAAAGLDYAANSGTLNWASGDAATRSFSVQLVPGAATSGDLTLNVALSNPTAGATLGSPASTAITIHHTPVDHWRFAHFGVNANIAGVSGDLVDPNGNGLVNLLEYALLGEPFVTGTAQGALPVAGRDASQHLTLSFLHALDRSDATLIVQATDTLGGQWTDLAQSVGGASFSSLQPGVTIDESGPANARVVTVSDLYSSDDPAHPHRFLRLEVTR